MEMKKALFLSMCCAALTTACTNDELAFEQPKNDAKGIIFNTTIEGCMTADTRGELEYESGVKNPYSFKWYAEQDRINIYADNVAGSTENSNSVGVVADWNTPGNPAVYKATQSAKTGWFTAKSDENWIKFAGENEANIVASYPESTIVTKAETDATTGNVTSIALSVTGDNGAQTLNYNQVVAPMYSISTGKRDKDYESVGEKANISFKRAFPVLRFTSAADNNDYNEVLGKLTSIKIEMKGAAADADGFTLAPSNIAAASATYSTKDLETKNGNVLCNEPTLTTGAAAITTTLATQSLWDNANSVYMSIYPVKREAEKDGAKKQMEESYTVTYTYENVELAKNLKTSADWNIQNAVYRIEELNIAEDYTYIVTKDEKTLMVFSGAFSQIDVEGKDTKIAWNNGEVDKSGIETIISNVALTEDELKTISTKFTGLKNLTLKENTSISTGTFTGLGAQIEKLELPKVTEYKDENAFSKLVNLDINSYEFADEDVYSKFFNEKTKNTLETLKIEGMTSMRPTFGYDRTITFQDFTALETVALNPNGVALTANAFNGCAALKSVTGIMDITNAPSAFEDAGAADFEVNVSTTIIPTNAFKGSQISSVKKDGAIVVPTEIGANAFEGNEAIELMDLSAAKKIGASAFKGATNFKGVAATTASRGVVTINAETINNSILENTAVVRVQFAKATKIGDNILGATPNAALKQIKFLKQVTILETASTPFSADYTNVDLFVSMAQEDVTDTDLKWMGGTFKSITREDKPFSEQ